MRKLWLAVTFLLVAALAVPVSASTPRDAAPKVFVDPLIPDSGEVSVLMHVREGASLRDGLAAARVAGFDPGSVYESIDVFVAYGPSIALGGLAATGDFEGFEANRVLSFFTDNSHKATRGQNVLNDEVTMPDGTKIDGSGVGVAIVDSGIDGTHPDLDKRIGGNVKTVCTSPQAVATSLTPFATCRTPKAYVPMDDTDTPSLGGHGTHVSGIVAGDGTASNGQYHGAAPGATLFGVSTGTVISVENALDGLDWVLNNHDKVSPAIKVVNNSWGSGAWEYKNSPFHGATWKLQEDLVAAGVTVVFAAGNSGGNGSTQATSAECVNPTPGIICVANYDDGNNGNRNGSISSSSSRGASAKPGTWPDIAAPGTSIKSTCRTTLPVCVVGNGRPITDNLYGNMSGTSMAAPHVAGIIAQMYQVKPDLTPAEVENILEDTAYKFSSGAPYASNDITNPDNTSSFDKGHGLVDALAAVQYLLNLIAPPAAP